MQSIPRRFFCKRALVHIQCRRRKSTDSASVKRKPQRVPNHERKAMVQAFVDKYKAINGGKFPPTKHAMKEVGGSYYTIKKIVQELQYNAMMQVEHNDTADKEASAGKAATWKDGLLIKIEETSSRLTQVKDGQLMKEAQNTKPSPEVEEILSDRQTIGTDISEEAQLSTIDGVKGEYTNIICEAEEKLQSPTAADNTILQENSRVSGSDTKDAAAPVLEPELKTSSHSKEPENNIKQEVFPMENYNFDDLKQIDEEKHSPELEKPTRELPNKHKADPEAESKSSMWENLKSLADGILNIWRK